MAVNEIFAIWNNKGGVGKSTITFHLASRYAEKNKNSKVLVIDLCPRANSSMMLLGGGTIGEKQATLFCSEATPKRVVGYLSHVVSGGQGAPLPQPSNFMVRVKDYNLRLPDNIYLLCGDGNLEPMSPAIIQAANAPSLIPSSNPWVWIHQIFLNLVHQIAEKEDWMIFKDTNPSFSIYTELAISAAIKLIVTVNADDSSRVATNAMFILLHGTTPPHPVYGSWTFATRATTSKLRVPQVHMIVGNRLTQYEGAAAAFRALSDATADTLYAAFTTHPHYFTTRSNKPKSIQEFRDTYSISLRDFNTAGVVSAHLGSLLSSLKQGYFKVHNTDVKVNADQIKGAKEAVDSLLESLDR